MGWTYYYKPKGVKALDSIKAGCGAEWLAKHYVTGSATREAVFIVAKFYEPESDVYVPDADGMVRVILVYKINMRPKDAYNFGYKDMSETCGPYGCFAPASIIEAASPLRDPIGPLPEFSALRYARNYREASLAHKAVKAKKRGLKPGQKVKLPEPLSFGGHMLSEFTVERCSTRRGVVTAFRANNGMLCALRARNLVDATIT